MVFFVPHCFPFTLIIGKSMWGRNYGFVSFVFNHLTDIDKSRIAEHEQIHEEQFWRDFLYPLKYHLSKKARLEYETEAYIRIDHFKYNHSISLIVNKIQNLYNLRIPYSQLMEYVQNRVIELRK